MTVQEAMRRKRVSRKAVLEAIERGTLRACKRPTIERWDIDDESVREWRPRRWTTKGGKKP